MKATGIVRRIDDLGRVVIPKEIRRTLHIKESDPLEIYTDREGEIILKKYSPIGEMSSFAKQYVESLAQVSGRVALITDRDQFIATAGGMKNLIGKPISKELENRMEDRELIVANLNDSKFINIASEGAEEVKQQAICPILSQGDIIGSVLLLDNNEKSSMNEVESKLVMSAAAFLGRQLED